MKISPSHLSSEQLAQVLHDEHALASGRGVYLSGDGHACIPMWKAKVDNAIYTKEMDLWRRVAKGALEALVLDADPQPANEILARDDHQPEVSEQTSLRSELIIQGNLAQERGHKIEGLEKRLADETAKLYECVDQVQRLTDDLVKVTTERDHLKSQLSKVKAVTAAWDVVFNELRETSAA